MADTNVKSLIHETVKAYRKAHPPKVYHHRVLGRQETKPPVNKLYRNKGDEEMKANEAIILMTAFQSLTNGLDLKATAKVIELSVGTVVGLAVLEDALRRNRMWDESWELAPFEAEKAEWAHEDVQLPAHLKEPK